MYKAITTLVRLQERDVQHDEIELLCLIKVMWGAHYQLQLRILKIVIFSIHKYN